MEYNPPKDKAAEGWEWEKLIQLNMVPQRGECSLAFLRDNLDEVNDEYEECGYDMLTVVKHTDPSGFDRDTYWLWGTKEKLESLLGIKEVEDNDDA